MDDSKTKTTLAEVAAQVGMDINVLNKAANIEPESTQPPKPKSPKSSKESKAMASKSTKSKAKNGGTAQPTYDTWDIPRLLAALAEQEMNLHEAQQHVALITAALANHPNATTLKRIYGGSAVNSTGKAKGAKTKTTGTGRTPSEDEIIAYFKEHPNVPHGTAQKELGAKFSLKPLVAAGRLRSTGGHALGMKYKVVD